MIPDSDANTTADYRALPCQRLLLTGGDCSCLFVADRLVLRAIDDGGSARALRLERSELEQLYDATRLLRRVKNTGGWQESFSHDLTISKDDCGIWLARGGDSALRFRLTNAKSSDDLLTLMTLLRRRLKGFAIGEGEPASVDKRIAVAAWPSVQEESYDARSARRIRAESFRLLLQPLGQDRKLVRLELSLPNGGFALVLDQAALERWAVMTREQFLNKAPDGFFITGAEGNLLYQSLATKDCEHLLLEWNSGTAGSSSCHMRRDGLARLLAWTESRK